MKKMNFMRKLKKERGRETGQNKSWHEIFSSEGCYVKRKGGIFIALGRRPMRKRNVSPVIWRIQKK